MPEPPALIGQFSLELMAVLRFAVTAVFINGGDQLVGVVFKIIYLGRFEPHIVHTHFFGQLLYIFYLVFVWFYHQELEHDKRFFTFQFFFPFHNIPRAFNDLIQLPSYAVLLVYILGGTVDRNDQPVEPAFNGPFGIGIVEVMGIGEVAV